MNVELDGVTVVLDGATIIEEIALTAGSGTVTGLIGPNGSGKSTLLRCVYRALRPRAGAVHVGEEDVWALGARRAGLRTAVVTQDHDTDHDFSVTEIVAMGRTPHKRLLDRDTTGDATIVADALERVEMSWAAQRRFVTLSGGERQRVLVARALAQQAPVLLLDEPTNHLDIGAQLKLLELVRGLDLTTVAALHDLNHAVAVCDRLVLLCRGRVEAAGPPAGVLTAERVQRVFGVRSAVVDNPLTGRPLLVTALPAVEELG